MQLFSKLKTYAIVFRRLLQKQVAIESIKQNPKMLIRILRNHSIFRLDTHRNPAYLCAITNY